MFENFMHDKSVYLSLEKYISEEFDKIIQNKSWIKGYFKQYYSNGEPFLDGNPIFSAKNIRDEFIIKIIIEDEEDQVLSEFETKFENIKMIVYVIGNIDIKSNINKIFQNYSSNNF